MNDKKQFIWRSFREQKDLTYEEVSFLAKRQGLSFSNSYFHRVMYGLMKQGVVSREIDQREYGTKRYYLIRDIGPQCPSFNVNTFQERFSHEDFVEIDISLKPIIPAWNPFQDWPPNPSYLFRPTPC